ncbi:hypothetical protein [Oceanidesulfovibrio indonesiensis]|uniref:hypothetical protein n=1 Tax=Oceanidesulfovibrio indonesiensis TaxID=54767 RepID=UPI00118530BE|nr:hypothetical protein [Oceanidesulfovibrio indonesiensis]
MHEHDLKFKVNLEDCDRKTPAEEFACHVSLFVNGVIFDSEYDPKESKRLKSFLIDKYLYFFESELIQNKFPVAISLEGLHVDLVSLFRDNLFTDDARRDLIFHYHHWGIQSEGFSQEVGRVVIMSNKNLFRNLFKKFWFSVNEEIHFRCTILNDRDVFFRWQLSSIVQGGDNYSLEDGSVLAFDNRFNGFHFTVHAISDTVLNCAAFSLIDPAKY